MRSYIFTDLAYERDFSGQETPEERKEYREYRRGNIRVCKLKIDSEALVRKYGRGKGVYITVFCNRIWQMEADEESVLSEVIGEEIRALMPPLTTGGECGGVLIAGLGNSDVTPDAIGPETVKRVTVTRHLEHSYPKVFQALGNHAVAAIAPGVLAETGIETVEVISGAVRSISPDAVIVVDALAARSCDRLAATVQISNAGICPGSGIGNQRRAIDAATLGIPVIAVGVPTVVDSSTLIYDALQKGGITEPDAAMTDVLEKGRGFFVAPKECDIITQRVSEVLAQALNSACGVSYSG